jgi:F-type H+-transporting ATPase subunit gamma
MASLKELKGRIGSVKSTQKITKAKQMVAAAKLRKAQAAAEAARPYAERLGAVMASLASKVSGDGAPKLLAGTGSDQRNLIVLVNTDKGLCGGLNSNLVKAAKAKAMELTAAGKNVQFYLVGKKGRAPIRRDYPKQIAENFDTSTVRNPGFAEAEAIAAQLVEMYEAGQFDVAQVIGAVVDVTFDGALPAILNALETSNNGRSSFSKLRSTSARTPSAPSRWTRPTV